MPDPFAHERPTAEPPTADAERTRTDPDSAGGAGLVGSLAGFTLLDEIGRGGMGVVYRALDHALGREVAVKVLQDKFSPTSATAQRFLDEARITAQLQHPGIPAVYQVGVTEGGRPFLAMKLIKGHTLNIQLKENAELDTLGVFEGVCHAVGYAHAHEVIHRDLKPTNVMIGTFGEVQVMDWGLAKVYSPHADRGEDARPDFDATLALTEIKPARDTDTPFTQYGSVLGTPAFCAPEQAAGETDRIDRRADVFGLGAILCVMLTGRPPFEGKDSDEVRLNAIRGNIADALARLDMSGADPGVVTLCKRCLAFNPVDRPADGNEVAHVVGELRQAADRRAREAERERLAVAVQAAEQQKRRRVVVWGGAAVIALLATGTVVSVALTVWATDAERRTANQLSLTEIARSDAMANQERADRRTRELLESYNQMVFGIQNKLESQPGTLQLRRELLDTARTGLKRVLDDAGSDLKPDHTVVWAYYRLGDVESYLGHRADAQEAFATGFNHARGLAADAPDDPTGQFDLSHGYERLGNADLEEQRLPTALAHYQECLDIRRWLVKRDASNREYQRAMAAAYVRVGDIHIWLNRNKAGEEFYQKGLDVRLALAGPNDSDPSARFEVAYSYLNLGDAATRLGRVKDSLDPYQRCHDACEQLVRADPQNHKAQALLSLSCDRVGDLLLRQRRVKEALAIYQQGLDIRHQRLVADPQNVTVQSGPFFSYYKLGTARMVEQNFPEAAKWFGKAKDALEEFRKAGWLTQPEQRLGLWPRSQWVIELRQSLKACEKADLAIAEADYPYEQSRDVLPLLVEFRVKGLLKAGKVDDAVVAADRFAGWADQQKDDQSLQQYNAACVYIVCAAAATRREDTDAVVAKSLARLRKAKTAGRFDPAGVAHFHQDPDFDAVRERPDVVEFVNGLAPTPEK